MGEFELPNRLAFRSRKHNILGFDVDYDLGTRLSRVLEKSNYRF